MGVVITRLKKRVAAIDCCLVHYYTVDLEYSVRDHQLTMQCNTKLCRINDTLLASGVQLIINNNVVVDNHNK